MTLKNRLCGLKISWRCLLHPRDIIKWFHNFDVPIPLPHAFDRGFRNFVQTRARTQTLQTRARTHSHKIPGSQHLFLQAACNPTLCKAFSNSTIDISSLRRLTKPVPWPSTSACLIDKGCVLEIFCSLSALMLYQVSESASMKIWR